MTERAISKGGPPTVGANAEDDGGGAVGQLRVNAEDGQRGPTVGVNAEDGEGGAVGQVEADDPAGNRLLHHTVQAGQVELRTTP